MDDRLNGELNAVYDDPIQLTKTMLTDKQINTIISGYRHQGKHIVLMELEAFSVALLDDTEEQQRDIEKYCM